MSADKNGATVNPHAAPAVAECPRVDGRRGAHNFIWMWAGPYMLDTVKCTACGEIRACTEKSNEIIQPGKEGVTSDPV